MKHARLGDIATFVNGFAFKPADWGNAGLPIIRIQNLTGSSDEVNYYSGEYPKKVEVHDGDILISWSASLGVYIWKSGKALLNQHIFKVVFDKQVIDKRYFYYAVTHRIEEMISKTHGSTMKHIVKGDFEKTLIPTPPIEQQNAISVILDTTASLISLRKRQLEELDKMVKSRFVEMLGEPITNPMGWQVARLEEYILFMTSGSRGWSSCFANDGEMFITIKNVKNRSISVENMQHIHAPSTKEAERTRVKEGDLLISITADLGRTGVVDAEIANYGAYINQHLSLVRLDQKKVNPWFVSHYLETDAGKNQFASKNQVGVKAGLNFSAINSLTIITPPLELQNQYIRFVRQVDKSKFEIQQGLKKLELQYNALMQQYFG